MKILLNVENGDQMKQPKPGDLLLYDEKSEKWKLVNKKEIFAEFDQEMADLKNEWLNFKKEFAIQNKKVLNAVNAIIKNKGE